MTKSKTNALESLRALIAALAHSRPVASGTPLRLFSDAALPHAEFRAGEEDVLPRRLSVKL